MENLENSLRRLEYLHPRSIDLSLDRMQELLGRLGCPHERLPPVVHIAGTNGKGSTLAALRAVSEARGHRVHAYTSPHLVSFCERIRVAGSLVAEPDLIGVLAEVEAACSGYQSATFFELTTAAAFLIFSRVPADLLLLETGLGGRLDATNVVSSPIATVLTPISMDHEEYLGHSLEAVAREKVGILCSGVPCISAAQDAVALSVIQQESQRLDVPLWVQGSDYDAVRDGEDIIYTDRHSTSYRLPRPPLHGDHQIQNVAVALATSGVIAGTYPEAWAEGIARVQWPARLQSLRGGSYADSVPPGWELWLDGGHNPAAGDILAQHIQSTWHETPVDVIVGMLATKDASAFFQPLVGKVQRIRTVPVPGSEVGCDPDALAVTVGRLVDSARVRACLNVKAALHDLATETANQEPRRILICGSLYLAGAVLAHQSLGHATR